MKKLWALSIVFFAINLMAQTDQGTIIGIVRDQSGRVIVGAHLAVRSLSTNVEHKAVTDRAGVYVVTSLATGIYQVTVQSEGFASEQFNDVNLDVGQTRTLDAKLSVAGGVTQVEVQPDAGLSKSSAEIGGVFNYTQAADLPVNGRSFIGLLDLIPGAIDSGTGQQQDLRFGGLSDEDNTWHLDGIDNSGINNPFVDVNMRLEVSTEAIAEVRANGVAYSAEQGGSPGGQIEEVSKTGGDKFRGSAWEFIRNNVFDASPWDAAGQLPGLHYNDFGGNLGGPISKKRKIFFFVNYEGARESINQVLSGIVPTPAFKAQVAALQPVLVPLINAFPASGVTLYADSSASGGLAVATGSSTPIKFVPNNSEVMRVTPTGFVGIGTASPGRTLDVWNTSSQFRLSASSSGTLSGHSWSTPCIGSSSTSTNTSQITGCS